MAMPTSFPTMTSSRDTPNPLRPYYVPPSIGIPPEQAANATSRPSGAGSIGSSARDLLSDLDYAGPFFTRDGPTVAEMSKKILDQAIWKYTSVLLAQPFDVAKTIMQVRLAAAWDADADKKSKRQSAVLDERVAFEERLSQSGSESSDDEPSYFTPTKPPRSAAAASRHQDGSPSRRRHSRRHTPPSRSQSGTPVPSTYTYKLNLRRPDSVLDTLSQLWQNSGATGLWKATNASFIYNVLLKALESWTRSLLCALLNLPDPTLLAGMPSEVVAGVMGGLDLADSPSPLASLGVAVAASAVAAVLLSPLDLVRTRLIITPTISAPRAILPCLRLLPSLTTPSSLLPVTLLHSTLPTLITSSTPLVLRQYLRIDPLTTPASYSLATFLASTTELFLKLPLETALRRGQVAVLQQQHSRAYQKAARDHFRGDAKVSDPELKTVVDVGPYRGVVGTMWAIVGEEGIREPKVSSATPAKVTRPPKKGQGLSGLWRGWRVGMWGLVGVWGASALGGGVGGEF